MPSRTHDHLEPHPPLPADGTPPSTPAGRASELSDIRRVRVPTRIGPYKVRRRIGSGGMGEVFLAHDDRLERTVAIKRLIPLDNTAMMPGKRERFRREARLLAQLNHPAVVQIYDVFESSGGDSLVMEFVEGTDLRRLLAGGSLGWSRVLILGEQIADGLAAAHAKGIVHRDLKTENVLITPDDRVKITDFGIAKLLASDAENTQITAQGTVVGTFRSMSPEQARGEEVDARTDLFAFGTVLYELLTGRGPFESDSVVQTLYRILNSEAEPIEDKIPGLPQGLADLIGLLLAKDRSKRPDKAGQVAEELRHLRFTTRGQAESSGVFPGLPQTADPGTAERTTSERRALSERREVTVLCCEPVLYSEDEDENDEEMEIDYGDSEELEPLLDLLPEMRSLAEEVAARFEGHAAGGLGRRLILCFGYPKIHEDDTLRAARAARDLAERARKLRVPLRSTLHCGTAVVTVGTGEEPLILGALVDRAMALEVLAAPGDLIASPSAAARLAERFECEQLPAMRLPGQRRPLRASRVLDELKWESGAARAGMSIPVVAREKEMGLLRARLAEALTGFGRAVLLRGDAGIGKSRLARAMCDDPTTQNEKEDSANGSNEKESTATEALLWRNVHGSSEARSTPFQPIVELLRRLFDLAPEASPADQHAALRRAVLSAAEAERIEIEPALGAALLSELFGLDAEALGNPHQLSPLKARRKTMEIAVDLLLHEAEQRPMAILVEDLHWADPSTLELLGLLIDRLPTEPLFLLLTSRPELDPIWSARPGLVRIDLDPLDSAEAELLVNRLVAARQPDSPELPDIVRRQIVERAGGVPLYLEEVTKTALEGTPPTGTDGDGSGIIPTTLLGTLSARLDRLGTAKEVAQLAAVVGRDVPYTLLRRISPFAEHDLEHELERLVEAEILEHHDDGRRRRYLFRHSLLRDAAYGSLLARERHGLHRRLSTALLEIQHSGTAPFELLAHHCAAAGEIENAVLYWLEAGERAVARSANLEGIDHLQRGLEALASLPEDAARDRLELRYLARLGTALSVTRGYASPEVEDVYARAEALCRDLSDHPQLFWVVWGLWSFHVVSARLGVALDLGAQLQRMARSRDDFSMHLVALSCIGYAHYFRGDLLDAEQTLLRGLELDSEDREDVVASPTGQDVGVTIRSLLALVRWHRGEDAAAVAESDSAIALARRLGHPLSVAFALVFGARLHQSRRNAERCAEMAHEAVALSTEKGFFWVTQGYFLEGCALAEGASLGDATGLDQLTEADLLQTRGFETFRKAGARLSRTYMLAQMAEARLRAERFDEADACLDEADDGVADSDEGYWQPELLRLRGELCRARGDQAAAAEHFRGALELAKSRGDHAFVVRAERSLAKL